MKRKAMSIFMAAVLTAGSLAFPSQAAEADGTLTEISDGEMQELLDESVDGTVTARVRQSVHDPSVVATGKNYYVFGSHMAVAKTTDLSDWDMVTSEALNSTLFEKTYKEEFKENAYTENVEVVTASGGKAEVDFGTYDIADWISDNTIQGNMWAPDVIYNDTMGKWCMYLSLNGAKWNSAIVLLTADVVEGPYIYQGPVVFSGFSLANSSKSFDKTDLELVLGELTELPEKYQQITNETKGNWGTWWPHAIDPGVFYDAEGKLWMTYGSWSGGICMLELDEETGLRDYTVTYESDSDTKGQSYTSDAYFGKRIAGGYYVSGEGPYIQQIGEYYYLFMSYGFYSPEGGYNMRIFRSKNPDGPYVDSQGTSAIFTSYIHNYRNASDADKRGVKLMGGYKWYGMDNAEVAQGHNSAFVDDDGNAYVVYHTKFADGSVSHEIRVHQLFVNETGWLVAAPYEYGGETLSETGYAASEVAGEYDIIVHQYAQDYANLAYETPVQITLEEDGTITGAYTGSWSVDAGETDITLVMENLTYKGVLIEQKVDGETYEALCFTVVNEEGLSIWGSATPDAKEVIASNLKYFDFGVPERTYESFTLPVSGNSGASIAWSSSNPNILTAEGKLVAEVEQDVVITLTATISKGNYYYDADFPVVVKAGDGTYGSRTLLASYFVDDPQNLSDKLDGSLYVGNPYYKGNSLGLDISGGVSIEFDVECNGDVNVLGAILAFTGGGKLYFTPGSYLGYNATGGYYDANLNDYKLVKDYIGDSAHVGLYFYPDGFEVKMDGVTVYTEEILKTENGIGTLTNYNNVLKWLYNNAATLQFGSGSWWEDAGKNEANCTIENVQLFVEPAADSKETAEVWYEKEEVVLSSDSSISYEENPFYGKQTDTLYLEYTIQFASDAAKNGWDGIMSFYDSATGGRISVQTNPYVCYNSGCYVDLNRPSDPSSTNWAATANVGQNYRVTILITRNGARMTIDGQEIALGYDSNGADYGTLLDFLSECDKLTFGVGKGETSYWWTEICTLKDIVIASAPYRVQKVTTDSVVIDSADFLQVSVNPFYGKDLISLDIEYTLNFEEGAAKNGWDGIFSFYNSATTGRVSMQTNPYLCYNERKDNWIDINNPDNAGSGGTNWASSTAVKGTNYRVKVSIDRNKVVITIDGEEIALSNVGSGAEVSDLLAYISKCDQFTFGVGKEATSFWWTELATLSSFTMKAVYEVEIEEEEETPAIITLEDGSKRIIKASAIEQHDNPLYGEELKSVRVSYDIEFAENAVKTGWDGLFSFYNPTTTARVSFQSGPYLCYNDMAGSWADINSPILDGSTAWAASAQTGQTYHVDVVITEGNITMTVDGTEITLAQNQSESFTGYGEILDCIADCEVFTIGVGEKISAFWYTELCTLSNIEVVGNEQDSDAGDDVNGGDSGDVNGGDSGDVNDGDSGDVNDSDSGDVNDGDSGDVNDDDSGDINGGDDISDNDSDIGGQTTAPGTSSLSAASTGEAVTVTTSDGEKIVSTVTTFNRSDVKSVAMMTHKSQVKAYMGLTKDRASNGEYARLTVSSSRCGKLARQAVTDVAGSIKAEVATILEIDLEIYNKNGAPLEEVTQLTEPVEFIISAPAGIDGNRYDFAVISLHDGQLEILPDLDDDPRTITFVTDRFSVYAVVYSEKGSFDVN